MLKRLAGVRSRLARPFKFLPLSEGGAWVVVVCGAIVLVSLVAWLSHGYWWARISGQELVSWTEPRLPDVSGPRAPEDFCLSEAELDEWMRRGDCSKEDLRFVEVCCLDAEFDPDRSDVSRECRFDHCAVCALRLRPEQPDQFSDGLHVRDLFAVCGVVDARWEVLLATDAKAPSLVAWVGEVDVDVDGGEVVSVTPHIQTGAVATLVGRTLHTSDRLIEILAASKEESPESRYELLDAGACSAPVLENLKGIYDEGPGEFSANAVRYAWFRWRSLYGPNFGPSAFQGGQLDGYVDDSSESADVISADVINVPWDIVRSRSDWSEQVREPESGQTSSLTSERRFCILETKSSVGGTPALAQKVISGGRLPELPPRKESTSAPGSPSPRRQPMIMWHEVTKGSNAGPELSDGPQLLAPLLVFASGDVSAHAINSLVAWGEPEMPALVAGGVAFWVALVLVSLLGLNLVLLVFVNLRRIFGSKITVVSGGNEKQE